MSGLPALDIIDYNEGQLEALFRRCTTLDIATLVNQGSAAVIDPATRPYATTFTGRASSPRGMF